MTVLWLITSLLLIKCKFYKPKQSESSGSAENNDKDNYGIKDIKKACSKKDDSALQKALISWASIRFDKEIFSILDIGEIVSELKPILRNLNAAMYSDKNFDQYVELIKIVSSANKVKNKNKSIKIIKGLYN